MANSDITIKDLGKIGSADAQYLVSLIRSVPGFPKEGIIFRDFMPVLGSPRGLDVLLRALEAALPVQVDEFDLVAGMESRGFLFGPALAHRLGKGFIPLRKAGKLPPNTFTQPYDLEYGSASLEIECDAIQPGSRVLVVDDLIATGGTARAGADLVMKAGGTVVAFSFVMELEGLNRVIDQYAVPMSSLVSMPA